MKIKIRKHKRNKQEVSKKGLPPGTHVYTGKNIIEETTIEVIEFDTETVQVSHPSLKTLLAAPSSQLNQWINVNGVSDQAYVKGICDQHNIHFLYQEDIMNVYQRPKLEEEDHYIYLTFKSLEWNNENHEVIEEQFSFILLENLVITFQEKPGDNMDLVRDKLKAGHSAIMERPIDYLFYRLIDVTVDNYFDIIEKIGDQLEILEDEILAAPKTEDLIRIQNIKKGIMMLRKSAYPMRDVLNKIVTSDNKLINEKSKKYFKDILDHTIQIIETTETYRDINMSLKDIYLNAISHEMNKVMKTLTIMSTLFIPLTFIVGVYGMNFKYIPELEWPNGYFYILGIMVVIVIILSLWFKHRKWF